MSRLELCKTFLRESILGTGVFLFLPSNVHTITFSKDHSHDTFPVYILLVKGAYARRMTYDSRRNSANLKGLHRLSILEVSFDIVYFY